jgi:Tfp pilus assembly protein PilF
MALSIAEDLARAYSRNPHDERKESLMTSKIRSLKAPPKVVELLDVLCEQPGALVSKEALFARLWPEEGVDDSVLWQTVYLARKALGEAGAGTIETLPRRGYRLLAAAPRPRRYGWAAAAAALLFAILAGTAFAVTPRTRNETAFPSQALQAYNLGTYYLRMRTDVAASHAQSEFETAIRIAPDRAAGYAGLAQAYIIEAIEHAGRRNALLTRAEAAARLALDRDPRSSVAQTALAAAAFVAVETADATRGRRALDIDRAFRTAIAYDPDDATARAYYGAFLLDSGAVDESFVQLRRAVDLDPTLSYANVLVAKAALLRHDAPMAIHYATEALGFGTSDKDEALLTLGRAYDEAGRPQAALQAFRELARYAPAISSAVLCERRGGRRCEPA